VQLASLNRRLTPAQFARREKNVHRRAAARFVAPPRHFFAPQPSMLTRVQRWMLSALEKKGGPTLTFAQWIAEQKKTHREAALKFAGVVARARARLLERRAKRCPHQYKSFGTIDAKGRVLKTDACGGKLHRLKAGRLACGSCGREWKHIGARQLVAA
jgi:hypothetical protein